MSSRHRHRLDANHSTCRSALEAMGFLFLDCSQTGLGFDALVAKYGRLTPIEIKDGAKSPSRLRLTPHEEEVHAALKRHGVRVELITGLADIEILGREHKGRREG